MTGLPAKLRSLALANAREPARERGPSLPLALPRRSPPGAWRCRGLTSSPTSRPPFPARSSPSLPPPGSRLPVRPAAHHRGHAAPPCAVSVRSEQEIQRGPTAATAGAGVERPGGFPTSNVGVKRHASTGTSAHRPVPCVRRAATCKDRPEEKLKGTSRNAEQLTDAAFMLGRMYIGDCWGDTRKIRITTLTRVEFSTRSSTQLERKETVKHSVSSTSPKKV
jgi:hypothetical protein